MMTYRIFVVDDDKHYARMLSYRLDKNPNYTVKTFNRGEDVLQSLGERPDLMLLDIMMPGIDGIEVLRRTREVNPDVPVIMVSAQGVIDTAVEAMKLGAYDYITKGQDDLIKLETVVKNVLDKVSMTRELESLREEVSKRYAVQGLIGDSPAMQKVYRLIHKALRGDLTVAIQGESGTGKELVAKAIHYNGKRKRAPFVVVNSAAIPRDLMESEFFGHEKGSFTGATSRKIGKFEQAHNGTIFLDEIGELDLDLQAKLLRVLQGQEFQRVGGNQTIEVNVRVISATNRDIIQMIRDGKFREDLYYRLFQYPVQLPPLRERSGDILILAAHFLKEYIRDHEEFRGKTLSGAARRAIVEYSWPGNVRELKSAIERAILIADTDDIQASDLMLHTHAAISPWADRLTLSDRAPAPAAPVAAVPQPVAVQPVAEAYSIGGADAEEAVAGVTLGSDDEDIVSLEDLKRQAVERAYRLCDGNVDKAAVELGIGRATMYRLLKKYGVMT
ncbi:MAG: sigma-54 dependent transcriptional regulator [Rhodothermales bacterium]